MIDCDHLEHHEGLNFCNVAKAWAEGVPVPVTEAACKVCLGCPMPKSLNRVTVSIGMARLRTENPETYERKTPESIQYLVDVGAGEAVKRYVQSTTEWVQAGRPSRTDDEVLAILKVCGGCEEWTGHSCKICGCEINDSTGWTNKARRTTEHCPKGNW